MDIVVCFVFEPGLREVFELKWGAAAQCTNMTCPVRDPRPPTLPPLRFYSTLRQYEQYEQTKADKDCVTVLIILQQDVNVPVICTQSGF